MTYQEFIESKLPRAEAFGFEPETAPHDSLKPHQRDVTKWMMKGGRRACFASFGLGKTRMDLQIAKWVSEHEPNKKFLIIAPLGVRQEFISNDGPAMGMRIEYCRSDAEISSSTAAVVITNYERIREGNITISPETFSGVALDEASCLRSYGSKTFQTFLPLFKGIPYRFVFTATPSPNRHKELIHYAAFLGVMDSGEALTRFFKRDSTKANELSIYPHMIEKFWLWVSSWAVFITKPSDLGYDDTGYDLPPLNVHWHRLPADHTKAWQQYDSWGQAQLLSDQTTGLAELAGVKRETAIQRLAFAKELMASDGRLVAPEPVDLIDQVIDRALNFVQNQHVLKQLLAGVSWSKAFGEGSSSLPVNWMGNAKGIKIDGAALVPASRILKRAKQYQAQPERHWILWHDLEYERHLIEKAIPEAKTAYGSQDLDERESVIQGFARGEFAILATKPSIAGSGTNLQRHCSDAIFLGANHKFHDFIQAVHRIQRFQQPNPVNIHIIYSESEDSVIEDLKRKWAQHDALTAKMIELLKHYKLSINPDMQLTRDIHSSRAEVTGEKFRAIHNDCVLEVADWPDNCVDEIVTSIPFGTQYEYSPSLNDMGHNPNNEEFFKQLDFLIPHLLRILRPGRVACIHVKDRIRFGNVTGFGMPTVDRFSDKTADAFEKHGFKMMGRVTIDTDVVRENNQTYRLGWTENSKDSTKMGCGMSEYVLLLRKLPSDTSTAYADMPVTKDKSKYTRAQWQIDAAGTWKSNGNKLPDPDILRNLPHDAIGRIWKEYCLAHGYSYDEHVKIGIELEQRGKLPSSYMLFPPVSSKPDIWTDIARMRTLNMEQASNGEEAHVCPLQLDIVERLINRYSNPGEIVLDPFGGIMTVPYMAIKMGRIGWGVELSQEYWECGVGYCEAAEAEKLMPTLFDIAELQTA